MLFKVTDKPVREDNNGVDSIPEFRDLTDSQLRYVILLTDYDTPLRQLSYKDRQEQAAEDAGYARENAKTMGKQAREMFKGKNERVNAAIERYKKLQRDLDRETLQAFDNQLEQFIKKASEDKKDNKDWEIALKITSSMPKLVSMRKELVDKLDLRADFKEESSEDEEVELSTLDRMMQKRVNEAG